MGGTGHDVRVLVLEDELIVGMILQESLRQARVDVRIAPDIASARRLLDSCAFDLAFCDMNLPDGSGLDIYAEATARGVEAFLMTSNPRPDVIPPERYMQKPDIVGDVLRICREQALRMVAG